MRLGDSADVYVGHSQSFDGSNSTVRYSNIETCKSSHFCAVCQHTKLAKRSRLIADAIKGEDIYMATLTVPHKFGSGLKNTLDALRDGFKNWKRILDRKHGIELSYIRRLEVTFTRENGWHPHYHVLVKGKLHESLRWIMSNAWIDAFNSIEWDTPHHIYGINLLEFTNEGAAVDYVSKAAGYEISGTNKASIDYFRILDQRWPEKWQYLAEYAEVMGGQRLHLSLIHI